MRLHGQLHGLTRGRHIGVRFQVAVARRKHIYRNEERRKIVTYKELNRVTSAAASGSASVDIGIVRTNDDPNPLGAEGEDEQCNSSQGPFM